MAGNNGVLIIIAVVLWSDGVDGAGVDKVGHGAGQWQDGPAECLFLNISSLCFHNGARIGRLIGILHVLEQRAMSRWRLEFALCILCADGIVLGQ